MSYCRFQNTAQDLKDCYDHIHDELSPEENLARKKIIQLCLDIVSDVSELPEEE